MFQRVIIGVINIKLFIVYFLCILIVGCTQAELTHKAIAYNKALAEFGDQQILLNAVRASKRYPMYFSALGGINAQPSLSGSLGSTLNFNPTQLVSYSINPKTSFTGGFSSATITGLSSDKFNKAILDPVDLEVIINNFTKKGWPIDIVVLMFVQELRISEKTAKLFNDSTNALCYSHKRNNPYINASCTSFEKTEMYCKNKGRKTRYENLDSSGKQIRFFIYSNEPENKCAFSRFRDFALTLKLTETELDFGRSKIQNKPKVSKIIDNKRRGRYSEETFSIAERTIEKEPTQRSRILKIKFYHHGKSKYIILDSDPTNKPIQTSIVRRSPQGLIYYVGKIIRAQLRSSNPQMPKLVNSDGEMVPIFLVQRGAYSSMKSSVKVTHKHDTFVIPQVDNEGKNSHRSLQILALIKQVFGLKTSRDDLPRNPNTIVISD